MNKILAATAALLLTIPAAGAAARDGARFIALLDVDGDGAISKVEFEELRTRIFEAADRNHDGVVDEAELKDARQRIQEHADVARARIGIAFRRLDQDGDGKVTLQEVQQRAMMFDLLDRNGDGKLTPDEMAKLGRFKATGAN